MTNSTQVVLVTGGARRIGAGIVERFHSRGYRVLIHCHQSINDGHRLAERLNAQRPNSAVVIVQDLAESEALSGFVEHAHSVFGQLDCLVNNASVFHPTPFDQLSIARLDQTLDVNLKAPLLLSQAAAQVMAEGTIVNIVDIYGEKPLADYLAYCLSKAALVMLTRSLALELAPRIRVNGVSPGAILWPEDAAELSEQDKQDRLNKIPMGRPGEPDDIARAVVFLAGEAGFVTGQILAVDGGQLTV